MEYRQRGTGSLHRPGGSKVWWIRYYVDGRRIEESSGTRIKQEAVLFLQRRIGEAERGEQPAADLKKITYEQIRQDALDEYSIQSSNARLKNGAPNWGSIGALDKFFAGKTAASIKRHTIVKFIASRKKAGASGGSINRSLALLRRMLTIAVENEKLQKLPTFPDKETEGPPRRGFIDHEQFSQLYAVLPDKLRTLVLLLYWSGIRVGEAQAIQWSQVDLRNKEIILEAQQAKTGVVRIIPLPDQLIKLLKAEPNKTGPTFYQGEFRRSWASACQKAGLGTRTKEKGRGHFPKYKGILVHDLRRSAIRNLRNSGVAQSTIMAISGHKTDHVFRRYAINSREDIHRAMRQVQTVDVESSFGERIGKIAPPRTKKLLASAV